MAAKKRKRKKSGARKARTRMVKVGKLSMPAYAAAKPVGLGAAGAVLTVADAGRPMAFAAPVSALDDADRKYIAYERTRMEPNFKLSVVNYGTVTKKELLAHIEEETPLGQTAVEAEMRYVEELVGQIRTPLRGPAMRDPVVRPAPIPPAWRWVKPKWRWVLKNTVLFCENTTDDVTSEAATYRKKHVHPVFKKRGFNVVCLEGVNDVHAKFEAIARSARTVYISGIGHGSPTAYTGHNSQRLLEVGQYHRREVDGKSLHFLSCKTAQRLGPDTVRRGANSYGGYHENFTFVWNDDTWRFWQSDSVYDVLMALGKTASEAGKAVVGLFNHHISQVPGTTTATWLTWDRNCFRCPNQGAAWGKKTARISPYAVRPFLEQEEAFAALDAV